MAANKKSDGQVIKWTNGGTAKVSGQAVVIGQSIGVCLTDIGNGETGSVAMDGVWDLPKVSAAVIAQGDSVIWDASAAAFDDNLATPASGDVSNCCIAWEAAGNGVTTIAVKLNVAKGTVA